MISIIFAVFLVLHGLVHLLYWGQSAGHFELQPGLAWPDEAWAFSRLLGNEATRSLANVLLILSTIVFITGAVGLFARQSWWRPVTAVAAGFSALIYLLLWNGRLQAMDNNGWVGILINIAVLVAILVFRWPKI